MMVSEKLNEYGSLPKVELHRHLEGSLRLQTLFDIARKYSFTLPTPANLESLSKLVQVQSDDNLTVENFLSKFNTLRKFYRSPEVIRRVTREAIEDAAQDNVKYLELRFTPVALSRAQGFPICDTVDWVCESARDSAREYGLNVRLIASVNRHEALELAEQVVKCAIERRCQGIVGLDLAGNEVQYSAKPFLSLFAEARQAGMKITLHAGEWGGPENVRAAIEDFHADRIGHGIRVLEDQKTIDLACERNTPFEVCLTSNYQTGAVKALAEHPASRMLAAGLNVNINTDDPSISNITLGNEYRLAVEQLKIPLESLKARILAGAQAAFLAEAEKKILVEALKKELYMDGSSRSWNAKRFL